MKPETILQSDILDILFENRNKEYGAYALRRGYDRRLFQAMAGTCLLVLLFVLLQGLKTPQKNILLPVLPDFETIEVVIPPDEQPRDKPEQQATPRENLREENATRPQITTDATETTVATQAAMDSAVLGTSSRNPDGAGTGDPAPPSTGGGNAAPAVVVVEPEVPTGPLEHADVMPAFNGDLLRFMLRHLRQPDDLEDGERIVVRVRFVVSADGAINDILVLQPGRPDLDQEVVRVVKKMPRWMPGRQGGRSVPVYFNLPVIFVRNGE